MGSVSPDRYNRRHFILFLFLVSFCWDFHRDGGSAWVPSAPAASPSDEPHPVFGYAILVATVFIYFSLPRVARPVCSHIGTSLNVSSACLRRAGLLYDLFFRLRGAKRQIWRCHPMAWAPCSTLFCTRIALLYLT